LIFIEKKSIKKITGKPTNIKEILNELKENIESENHWATFYLVQIFSERITDFIIFSKKDYFKERKISFNDGKSNFTIKKKVKNNRFSFGNKIRCLEELINSGCYTSKDFKTFLDVLKLLCFIRNRYMFHVTNYDEYSFIYEKKDMYKKEEHFIKNFKVLVERMKYLMNDFHGNSYEWHLLEENSFFLEHDIKSYEKHIERFKKSDGRRMINNVGVYEEIPSILSRISYVFILFLGRKNLNLLS